MLMVNSIFKNKIIKNAQFNELSVFYYLKISSASKTLDGRPTSIKTPPE